MSWVSWNRFTDVSSFQRVSVYVPKIHVGTYAYVTHPNFCFAHECISSCLYVDNLRNTSLHCSANKINKHITKKKLNCLFYFQNSIDWYMFTNNYSIYYCINYNFRTFGKVDVFFSL